MMSNSLGTLFRVTSFGESHGALIGVIVDGCPAGLALGLDDLEVELDRRKPGQSSITTSRQEGDKPQILSGVFDGHTTGAPICLVVWNKDADSAEYEKLRFLPRPGHADYTSYIKYGGFGDYRGSGRFSGRITAGFVMAGAIARKLMSLVGVEVLAHTLEIGGVKAGARDLDDIIKNSSRNAVHCADSEAAEKMIKAIEVAKKDGDSLGGIIEVIALNVPAGWGEPAFDTVEGELSKAFFAIPAVKAVEFGAGFEAARLRGSQNNDPFIIRDGRVTISSNNAGGILGGITSGAPVVVRLAIKPTPSIAKPQSTVNLKDMTETTISVKGRHDPCLVPRVVVVAEAMMAITLCDLALRPGALPRVLK